MFATFASLQTLSYRPPTGRHIAPVFTVKLTHSYLGCTLKHVTMLLPKRCRTDACFQRVSECNVATRDEYGLRYSLIAPRTHCIFNFHWSDGLKRQMKPHLFTSTFASEDKATLVFRHWHADVWWCWTFVCSVAVVFCALYTCDQAWQEQF